MMDSSVTEAILDIRPTPLTEGFPKIIEEIIEEIWGQALHFSIGQKVNVICKV